MNNATNTHFPECPECGAAPGQVHIGTCAAFKGPAYMTAALTELRQLVARSEVGHPAMWQAKETERLARLVIRRIRVLELLNGQRLESADWTNERWPDVTEGK